MKNKKDSKEVVSLVALGGLDEDGKNMMVVQINHDIYLIESGLKFPDGRQSLGVEFIVQDFTWLAEHKDQIRAVFITHGHDDVMGSLPFLARVIPLQIYATPFTAKQIEKLLKRNHIRNARIHVIHDWGVNYVGKREVVFFPATHSYPQAYGLAIDSAYGYIVYSGEFIQDYATIDNAYNSQNVIIHNLRDKGVFILMQDSKGANRAGHTAPDHKIGERFRQVLDQYRYQRIFVTVYTQSVYWIQEIIHECKKAHRKICFYTRTLQDLIAGIERISEHIDPDMIIPIDQLDHYKNAVVIVSGQGPKLFRRMINIANDEARDIEFREDDVIAVATPLVPGVERIYRSMENDIYKREGIIIKVDEKTPGMHPAQEDLKLMIYLMQPDYYIPIKGEYRLLCANAKVAKEMGIPENHILILDNYQVARFENGRLVSTSKLLDLHETPISGKETWDLSNVVLKDRELLASEGVVIAGIGIDEKSHEVVQNPDVQIRGVIFLRERENISNEIKEIMIETIKEQQNNPQFDLKFVTSLIRDRILKYIYKKTSKRPMVLPVVLELESHAG